MFFFLFFEGLGGPEGRALLVEPLLTLEDLGRFVLQTSPVEDADYLAWCEGVVGKRVAERPVGSSKPWRLAHVLSCGTQVQLPVHRVRYQDGAQEEAALLLHLRDVVVLEGAQASFEPAPPAEASRDDEPPLAPPEAPLPSDEASTDMNGGRTPGSPSGASGATASPAPNSEATSPAGAGPAAQQAEEHEYVHKLVLSMPMVQAGEIPFEMVWGELLDMGEAVVHAIGGGTWATLGWRDRTEMETILRTGLEQDNNIYIYIYTHIIYIYV